jgi:peroxin-12
MDYYSSLNASSLDPDVPTLFELLSAKQLQNLISPSIRYILSFYAQRHPNYLLRFANKYDELYAVSMGLVEYHHLKSWNSSFTEKFYGIKRTRVLNSLGLKTRHAAPRMFETQRRLSKKQIFGSLFFIIGLPYIKEKLSYRYEVINGRYSFRDIQAERKAVKARGNWNEIAAFEFDYLLLKVYPTITGIESAVSLLFALLYLFSYTTASSPIDYILKMRYSRLNQMDYSLHDQLESSSKKKGLILNSDPDDSLPDRIVNYIITGQALITAKDAALSGLSYALPTSMFLLKFLEWWYASDLARQVSKKARGDLIENLPLPLHNYDAIDSDNSEKLHEISSQQSSGKCPLCDKEMENATVIETGHVFCYRCIYNYLESADKETGGRCPVTGQRLLSCRYLESTKEWEIGGLRRLMI